MDDASDPGPTAYEQNLPQDVRNLDAEKGLSSYDHRHRFVSSFVYEMPTPKAVSGKMRSLLMGWQLGGIVTIQSGSPFTVVNGVDRANIGAGPAQRPDLIRNPNLPPGERDPQHWFDTSAFVQPAPFTFGNAGRNIVTGPGLKNLDLSLQRNLRIERNSGSNSGGKCSTSSTLPISIFRDGSRSVQTSAESSARLNRRVKCNSGSKSSSELP
jgi:hypothetical protein